MRIGRKAHVTVAYLSKDGSGCPVIGGSSLHAADTTVRRSPASLTRESNGLRLDYECCLEYDAKDTDKVRVNALPEQTAKLTKKKVLAFSMALEQSYSPSAEERLLRNDSKSFQLPTVLQTIA